MITVTLSCLLVLALLLVALFASRRNSRISLSDLLVQGQRQEAKVDWSAVQDICGKLRSCTRRISLEDKSTKVLTTIIASAVLIVFVGLGVYLGGTGTVRGLVLGVLGGLYMSVVVVWLLLKRMEKTLERQALFEMPFFLEALSLLVEAGYGVLAAIDAVLSGAKQRNGIVYKSFELALEFAASGIPLRTAFEKVAAATPQRIVRHVLLHLDISANEGGELIPSLRALSDYAQLEWKQSIEQRVRRLENFVVFPVFGSVIGLVLLTAAVPLVPLFELNQSLSAGKQVGELLAERELPQVNR